MTSAMVGIEIQRAVQDGSGKTHRAARAPKGLPMIKHLVSRSRILSQMTGTPLKTRELHTVLRRPDRRPLDTWLRGCPELQGV